MRNKTQDLYHNFVQQHTEIGKESDTFTYHELHETKKSKKKNSWT